MRGLVVVLSLVARVVVAQQPAPATPDSARVESTPAPRAPVETPAQLHYRQGLKTVGRGIAQLKDGIEHVVGAGHDSARLRQAGQRLAGMCGAAQGFLARGRPRMAPTAYEDSTGIKARRLSAQIDTLVRFVPACQAGAARQPAATAAQLFADIKAYEAALRDYRSATGLPNRGVPADTR
jgi:hypothetical protein